MSWNFAGNIAYTCQCCQRSDEISINDCSIESAGGSEEPMGWEELYDIEYEFDCPKCNKELKIFFQTSIYPVDTMNLSLNLSTGVTTSGEPELEYQKIYYEINDYGIKNLKIEELYELIVDDVQLLSDITSRQFEQLVARILEQKGYTVQLTPATRDGGKDIIALIQDNLGINHKYIIECKLYGPNNKVTVEVIRSLYGVMNEKDGASKAIVVTTSSFTKDATDFAENKTNKKWDLTLIDREKLIGWLRD